MIRLNLPEYEYKVRLLENKRSIFDPVRKKYVSMTPEEWVRQHFINYLLFHLNYSKALIKVEAGLKYNQLQKRSDIKIFDRTGNLFMLIECKAYTIALDDATLHQICTYNYKLGADYLVITNGLVHYCWKFDKSRSQMILQPSIPAFE